MNLLSRYKWHILFWTLYFIFWTGFAVFMYKSSPLEALAVTAIWFIGQGGICYVSVYLLIPRLFNSRRWVLFTLLFLASLLAGSAFVDAGMVGIINRIEPSSPLRFWSFMPFAVMADFFTAFLFIAIKLIRDKIKNDRSSRLLEKEKTETELRFLKSQMNPHFLFNAINSIYVLIRKDPEFAASTLVKFADMLRYQLYECNVDGIPIEKEIGYLDNYIGLEKLRKGNSVLTEYRVSESARNFLIAPLLIIPFVENAFKYVSSYSDSLNYVKIGLDYSDDLFELKVENTMEEYGTALDEGSATEQERPGMVEPKAGGIGLENVRRRLELIYQGRHTLNIGTNGKLYSVKLGIQII